MTEVSIKFWTIVYLKNNLNNQEYIKKLLRFLSTTDYATYCETVRQKREHTRNMKKAVCSTERVGWAWLWALKAEGTMVGVNLTFFK